MVLATIGLLDYVTGYEVTFYPFYSIPILLVLWTEGKAHAILLSLLSTCSWWVADVLSGHHYTREWLRSWDTVVRFLFFYLVVLAGEAVIKQRNANRKQIELLERQRKLEQELIQISEREQQRIGRDLHDGLGQYLVAIGLSADSLQHELEGESLRGAAAIKQIAGLLHDAVGRTRDLAKGLSPVDPHEGGLECALESLAASTQRLTGVPCTLVSDGAALSCGEAVTMHIYRIAQEALNNAIKHAKATEVIIALEVNDGMIALRVSDDGVGFDASLLERNGLGLSIMQYRANMIGGLLEIQPNVPSGTVVSCTVSESVNHSELQPCNL